MSFIGMFYLCVCLCRTLECAYPQRSKKPLRNSFKISIHLCCHDDIMHGALTSYTITNSGHATKLGFLTKHGISIMPRSPSFAQLALQSVVLLSLIKNVLAFKNPFN